MYDISNNSKGPLYKFNANCSKEEKQGEGPGSCGGKKEGNGTTSIKGPKTDKVFTKEEGAKYIRGNGNASRDFRMQRGNEIVQYRKGEKYPSTVELAWNVNNKDVQILQPGHDGRDTSTTVVKSGDKSAVITRGEKSATVALSNGKSRTFTGMNAVDRARRFSANAVTDGKPFDIKDVSDRFGESPALTAVKQVIMDKVLELAQYAKNPITPEDGRNTYHQIEELGNIAGFDETDWVLIRSKFKVE